MYTFYESPSQLDRKVLESGEPPFVSIYQHTQRGSAGTKQNKLTFKNLVGEAEQSLRHYYEKRDYVGIITQLEAFFESPEGDLWRHLKDGLAVLANSDGMSVCLLEYEVQNRSIVADSYHIKPLIKGFQFEVSYYLLELTKEKFELYHGDAQGFDKVVLPDDIENVYEEVFPVQDKDALLNFGSYGGLEPIYHGHKTKSDLINAEREKYFRYTDKMVSSIIGENSREPVILVTLSQHQSEFRSLSALEGLLQKGVDLRMSPSNEQSILKETTTLVIDEQRKALAHLADGFGGAEAVSRASAEPREIAHALAEQRVRTLLLDEGSMNLGRFDVETGAVSQESSNNPEAGDLGDAFALATYRQGGEVYILLPEEMPVHTGMAAFFRY